MYFEKYSDDFGGNSQCEFKFTSFPYQNRCYKNLESIHQVDKQTLHHQSINQMAIREGGKSH